jgi:spore coat protein U-like protein
MRLILGSLLLASLGLLGVPEARAQTCTATASDVFFGNVNTPIPQTDVAAPLTISCSGSPNATLRICVGIDPGGYFNGRRMYRNGTSIFSPSIGYEIYQDAGRSVPWDGGSRRMVTVALGPGGGGSASSTLYARMESGGSPSAGTYHSGLQDDIVTGEFKQGNSCNSNTVAGSFANAPFDVRVYVNGSCTITAGALLNFGTMMGSTSQQRDGTVQLTANCNAGLPYTIALNAGQVPGNTIANRRLGLNGSGPGAIAYQLYRDASRTQLWGDGATGGVHGGTGNGGNQSVDVYGRIPAGQPMPANGTYRDTVTATIVF